MFHSDHDYKDRGLKLNVLSDLHLSRGALPIPDNDADVVVLAGDIARPREAVSWACAFDKPVLYVPGNHEFYGGEIRATVEGLKRLCAGTCIRVLDDEEAILGGVRFLGSTLWTDFRLFDAPEERAASIDEARRLMWDFSKIRLGESLFSPEDSARLFTAHSAWLEHRLAQSHDGLTVVITHHAPSRQSIHPRFAGSLLNACFVSAAEPMVERSGACLWIHGHLHDSFDYRLNATRVVCNPRGYAKDGVNENPLFDPNFTIEIA